MEAQTIYTIFNDYNVGCVIMRRRFSSSSNAAFWRGVRAGKRMARRKYRR